LLHAQQARLREIAVHEGHPIDVERRFAADTMQGETGAKALLAQEGYEPVRFFAEMVRPLDVAIPDAVLPPGLEFRPVVEADHRRIFEAESEAFRDHWGYREWTDTDFAQIFSNPELDTSLWHVVWDGRHVAAVTEMSIHDAENAMLGVRHAWLDRVSTRRPWRGRGLARAMLVAAMRVAKERGMTHAALGVDTDNPTGALGLYQGLGFRIDRLAEALVRPFD
jgi:ribosomal protein S18 acetylase RimI-like enzyme